MNKETLYLVLGLVVAGVVIWSLSASSTAKPASGAALPGGSAPGSGTVDQNLDTGLTDIFSSVSCLVST